MSLLQKTWPLCSLLICSASYADLHPIDDNVLADITGQSAIKIDEIAIDNSNLEGLRPDGSDRNKSFTRITIGTNIELNANIDRAVIGKKPREGFELEADIEINGLHLGRIIDDESGNPVMENFKIRDPYIEIARNENNELSGIRLGFKEATGFVGHDEIISVSGNLVGAAHITSFGVFAPFVPIEWLGGITEYPYTNSVRSNEVKGQISAFEFLGDLNPEFIIKLAKFRQSELQATKNLFVGLQSENVNYPTAGAGPQSTSKPGFWVNLQDNYHVPGIGLYTSGVPFLSPIYGENQPLNNSFNPYF